MNVQQKMVDSINNVCGLFNNRYMGSEIIVAELDREQIAAGGNPCGRVVLKKSQFVEYAQLTMTTHFHTVIESIASEYGLKIGWNNTKTTFWIERGV